MSATSLAFGDRLRTGLQLLDLLKGFDFSKLADIAAEWQTLREAPDTRGKIESGLRLAKLVTQATPGTGDDVVVGIIDELAHGDLIEVVVRTVSMFLRLKEGDTATAHSADIAAVEAKAIPWALLLEIARFIAELIRKSQEE